MWNFTAYRPAVWVRISATACTAYHRITDAQNEAVVKTRHADTSSQRTRSHTILLSVGKHASVAFDVKASCQHHGDVICMVRFEYKFKQ